MIGPSASATFAAGYHQKRERVDTMAELSLREFSLRIDGMHCGSCIRRVNQALGSLQDIQVKEVRLGAARVSSNRETAPVDLAVAALAKAGYSARLEE
jgi:copper chaperone